MAVIGGKSSIDGQPALDFAQRLFKWLYGSKVVMIGVHVDAQAGEAARLEGTVDLTGALCSPIKEEDAAKEEVGKEEVDKGEEAPAVNPEGDWNEVDRPDVVAKPDADKPSEEAATKEDSQQQSAATEAQIPVHPLLSSSVSTMRTRS